MMWQMKLLFYEGLPGPVGVLLGGLAKGGDQVVLLIADGKFRSNAKQCGKGNALQQLPGVMVDLVLETGIAAFIGGRQIVDDE